MNKANLLICILLLTGLISCKKESPYEIRSLYIEYSNIPENIRKQIDMNVLNRSDTIYNWTKTDHAKDSIIYKYYFADELPESNLLDGTRKIRFSLLDKKDSIGNPYYKVELYKSEQSKWKRTWNLGMTPFYSDTIVSDKYIAEVFSSRLNMPQWKGLP